MKKIWASYKKPTPDKWRMIGDFVLVLIPVLETGIAGAPEGTFTLAQKYWLGFAISTCCVIFKFWTNTKKEQINKPENIVA